MLATFRYTLSSLRGQILGWGLGIAALGLILVPFYDVFMGQQSDFMQMIEGYPPEFLAFFGGDVVSYAAGKVLEVVRSEVLRSTMVRVA